MECQRELPIRSEQGRVKSAVLEVSPIEVSPPFDLAIEEGWIREPALLHRF